MAITQTLTNSFKSDLLSGGMNFNTTNRALTANTQDVFKIALYSSAATIGATTTAYTATDETTGTGYTAGGATLTISVLPTTSGSPSTTAYVSFANAEWTGATFSAAGALVYNSTNSNKSVAVLAFGSTKTVTAGTFTIQFPISGTGASIVQIA